MVATLLGIDKNQLRKWLCARKIVATGDVYVKPLTFAEVSECKINTFLYVMQITDLFQNIPNLNANLIKSININDDGILKVDKIST